MTLDEVLTLLRACPEAECLTLLLALCDEAWCPDASREWPRERAGQPLHPCEYVYVDKPSQWYWRRAGTSLVEEERNGRLRDWLVTSIGAVTCRDEPYAQGDFTRNRTSVQEAWCDLASALAKGPP